ncbi:MAG: nucleotidyltransferase domain-containing protein [Candidatus Micrarchaeota archaeon]|nr:nucleotidyltransferase domain-containing protein [Candidatus Micrarchaeota archaeon]
MAVSHSLQAVEHKPPFKPADAKARLRLLRTRLMESRYVIETVFGDEKEAQKVIQDLRVWARAVLREKPHLLGIGLTGSRVNGTTLNDSDVDLVLIADHLPNANHRVLDDFAHLLPVTSFDFLLGSLVLSASYHSLFIGHGLYDLPSYEVIPELTRFMLSARLEYFDQMERLLKSLTPEEFRMLKFHATQNVFDILCVDSDNYISHSLMLRLTRKTELSRKEINEIMDAYFCRIRNLQGIISIESELEQLKQQRESLGEFLI